MRLDLRFRSALEPRWASLYNRVAIEISKSFNQLIDSFSRRHAKSIDWWVSSPASRNTLASPLFHYCCCVALLRELLQRKDPIPEIITDSKAFKKTAESFLSQRGIHAKIKVPRPPLRQFIKNAIWPAHCMFGIPLKHFFLFIAAKWIWPSHEELSEEPLVLIDTFVMPGNVERDRYYPGILDVLSESEKRRICFVPLIYGCRLWDFIATIKRLRKSRKNFILKEDHLTLKDYLYAWGHFFRVRALEVEPYNFHGMNISPLINEEIGRLREFDSSIVALLNYCFAGRLRQARVKLRLVIDWFENQIIDRGWNAGFRRYFPNALTKGYQGFVITPHYLCMYPTREEKRNKVIPEKISVIGKGLVQSARRFCSELDVSEAPAFRYQHLWRERRSSPDTNAYIILVALPVLLTEADYILRLLADYEGLHGNNVRIWIKPHPTTAASGRKKTFGLEWPERFEFVEANFEECLEAANLLVTSMSSTCLEAMAKGIPVIVVGNRFGLTHNPIPEAVQGDLYRLCFTRKEVADAIKTFHSRRPEEMREQKRMGIKIREEFFEPVTIEGVRRFLELSP